MMTDKEAYKLIGERAAELAKREDVERKALEMRLGGKSWDEIEKWVYMLAIATLIGIPAEG